MDRNLSKLSNLLLTSFEKEEIQSQTKHGINVSRVISELATWYEKLRNAMDYREEEVIRRAAIERILKRRLLFKGILGESGEKIAGPLIRELLWARYFPESSISEEEVVRVAKIIDLYLEFRKKLLEKNLSSKGRSASGRKISIDSFIYELLSSRIETTLNKNKDMYFITNYIFHILRDHITITDDTLETRDIQIFIAVRRAFAKDDNAFLHYHLFAQYFGELDETSLPNIVEGFSKGYKEMEKQFKYPLKERILSYVKKQMPPFLVLAEIIAKERGNARSLIGNKSEFQNAVFTTSEARYKTITSKVRRAVIRAFIFILLTKFLFAFSVELTYDNLFLGRVIWNALAINIAVPPLLMVLSSLFIKTPDKNNAKRIYDRTTSILYDEKPQLDRPLIVSLKPENKHPVLNIIFTLLWWVTFILSFGLIVFALRKLDFNIASIGVFLFFIALVSLFTYRINQTAQSYTVPGKQSLLSPVSDFLFMPIVRVGRRLAEGLAQVNIFIYIFDYLIETPFKEIFGFLEQWFFFLQTKREELG